jgi:hypothetical protein
MNMKNNLLSKFLITAALLILAIPIGASGQVYRDRSYNRYDNGNQYDRGIRRELRVAIQRLDNAAARLENDVDVPRGRRVLGFFWAGRTDNRAINEIRDFRSAVAQLRNSANDQDGVAGSRDDARQVLNRGVRLDRYLRLRTGSSNVDADLSELRSNLHIIADVYSLRMPY